MDGMAKYFSVASEMNLFASRGEWLCPQKGNLASYLDFIFGGVDFRGKAMLDIGGGAGVFSAFAALQGASRVTILEPEEQGAREGAASRCARLIDALGLENMALVANTLQGFAAPDQSYDLVLMKDSVNHLDEEACIKLRDDAQAREVYLGLCRKVARLVSPGGLLIITDDSPRNFWHKLGVENPFCPGIEWHKHQEPELWSQLFTQAGFHELSLEWGALKQFRRPGRLLLGNRPAAYFFQSHFMLRMRRAA